MIRKSAKPRKPLDGMGKLFDRLGAETSEKALAELVAIGMPVIERLIEGREQGRPVCQPARADGRCFVDDISYLFGEVARAHPKAFVEYALARREHPMGMELVPYLGATRDPRVLPLLVEGSRSGEALTRRAAVVAMGRLADARAESALLDRIKDRDGLVSDAAMAALGVCGGEQALEILEKLAGKGKDVVRRGAATGAADAIRSRLGLPAVPRNPGRSMTVALDESHLTARQRAGRSFRVHVKVGDKVAADGRLASLVTKDGAFDLEAPFAGEVVEVVTTNDRVSVTVRQFVGTNGRLPR